MGVLRILDRSGHVDVLWRADDRPSVVAAEAEFDRLRGLGYQAFERRTDGEESVRRVAALDPGAEEVFFLRPVVGG